MLRITKECKVIIFLFFPISSLFAIDGSVILKELGAKQYETIKGIYKIYVVILQLIINYVSIYSKIFLISTWDLLAECY